MSDLHISEMDTKDWWDKYLPQSPKPKPPSDMKEDDGARGLDPKHYGVK